MASINIDSSKLFEPGGIQGGIEAIASLKTYESNFFHHAFVHFRKTVNWDVTAKYYWNRPPLNLRAVSAPALNETKIVKLFVLDFYKVTSW